MHIRDRTCQCSRCSLLCLVRIAHTKNRGINQIITDTTTCTQFIAIRYFTHNTINMERLKRSLTSNLSSERSTSTLSRSTSSREWLDALEQELSPAGQSSGGTGTNTVTACKNLGVGDVLKRALNLNDQGCESADDGKQAAAREEVNDTGKRRGSRRKPSFNIFSNRNNDPETDATTNEPKSKQLGCVWKAKDVRHSYSDIIYRRRSSNF